MTTEFSHQLYLEPGETINDRYAVLRRIARGGMGEVWAVRHLALNEEFAMKMLAPAYGMGDDTISRFDLEARIGASLGRKSHYIVPVIDHGHHHGRPFLVMPLIIGESLEDRIASGALTIDDTARVIRHVSRALTAAHHEGVHHRDLKPGNVLLVQEEDGRFFCKVTDFGLAKIGRGGVLRREHTTKAGMIMGTPWNMSPEQANGEEIDERCDVWALACIGYRCLTGRDAFTGRTTLEILGRVAACTFEPASKSREALQPFDAFFTKAFTREIGERFQTAVELNDAFAHISGVRDSSQSLHPAA